MAFGSGKQGKEPVLQQQCSPGSQVHTEPVTAMRSSDTTTRKQGEGEKQLERAAKSVSSQSGKVKPLKNRGSSELRQQVMPGGVQGIAEGPPASGIQVDVAGGKDG